MLNPQELEQAQADVYRQGREHAATGGALLSEARTSRVWSTVARTLPQATRTQAEAIVDSYTEGYSLGLDEYAQINDDTEGE